MSNSRIRLRGKMHKQATASLFCSFATKGLAYLGGLKLFKVFSANHCLSFQENLEPSQIVNRSAKDSRLFPKINGCNKGWRIITYAVAGVLLLTSGGVLAARISDVRGTKHNLSASPDGSSYLGGTVPDRTVIYQRQDPESTLPIDSRDDLFGILSLRFPLFEGGLRRAEVREAESREKQAGLALENLKKPVGIEVDAAYLECTTQKGVLKSLENQVAFARENYTSIIKQYEFGLTTSMDVIDSNTLLLTAERQRADAVYGYQLALLRVERATGRLLSTFLSGEPGLKSRTAGFVHHAEASQKPEEERSTID